MGRQGIYSSGKTKGRRKGKQRRFVVTIDDARRRIYTQKHQEEEYCFPAAAPDCRMEAKNKNARVVVISAHVKDPHVVQINPEPSTTVRLIACVASVR